MDIMIIIKAFSNQRNFYDEMIIIKRCSFHRNVLWVVESFKWYFAPQKMFYGYNDNHKGVFKPAEFL